MNGNGNTILLGICLVVNGACLALALAHYLEFRKMNREMREQRKNEPPVWDIRGTALGEQFEKTTGRKPQ